MQSTASLPPTEFDELLGRLPDGLDLDALALETKAIERRHEIEDGMRLLRMALARGPGGLSLSETAAWAEMIGLANLSDPAVKSRLDKSVDFLKAITSALLEARSASACLRWPGRPACRGWHHGEPARQQGQRLAGAWCVRPGHGRLLASG